MKVIPIENEPKWVLLSELKRGDAFTYNCPPDNIVWLLIDSNQCISLNDGYLEYFSDNEKVYPVDVTVTFHHQVKE